MILPTEQEEAEIFIQEVSLRFPDAFKLLFHIPNEGSGSRIRGVKLKKAGVKSGVPDYFLASPTGIYAGLFIELKRKGPSKLSENQKSWILKLNGEGYKAVVCRGAEDAIHILERYLIEDFI